VCEAGHVLLVCRGADRPPRDGPTAIASVGRETDLGKVSGKVSPLIRSLLRGVPRNKVPALTL
jgi:hypothetical protein